MRGSVLCLSLVVACSAALAQPARAAATPAAAPGSRELSRERGVFQTKYGDIHFGFLPGVAPITAAHIFKLVTLGAYNTNHLFRVDKGFVAQVATVNGNRQVPLDAEQQAESDKKVPLEVAADVKHTLGVLSMGRHADVNSSTSSFSILLGSSPHLDMRYTIFGNVTKGIDVLHKLETLETRKEGIFVMPKERITILSSYWYRVDEPLLLGGSSSGDGGSGSGAESSCTQLQGQLDELRGRYKSQGEELQRARDKCLPH